MQLLSLLNLLAIRLCKLHVGAIGPNSNKSASFGLLGVGGSTIES